MHNSERKPALPPSPVSDPGKCLPLVILTACSRPHNLTMISASLKAHLYDMEWQWVICSEETCTITHFQPTTDSCTFYRTSNPPRTIMSGKSSHASVTDHCHFGKPLLNHALDMIQQHEIGGLLFFLDDDTIVPPETRAAIRLFCREHFPARLAFTVQQINKHDKIRIDIAENPRRIDQGCYFIHTSLIGSRRFFAKEGADARLFHDADQDFYHQIRRDSDDLWIDLPVVGSVYNALR